MTESLRDQLLRLGLKPSASSSSSKPAASLGGKPNDKATGNRTGKAASRVGRSSEKPGQRRPHPHAGVGPKTAPGRLTAAAPGGEAEIDLARAYALRERERRAEQEAARRAAEQQTAARRERKRRLRELTQGQSLNAADADIARHFPHADKIKRIYVTATQLPQLNAGELGVVQIEGRFHLVPRAVALAVQAVAAEALVLLPDPDENAADDLGEV